MTGTRRLLIVASLVILALIIFGAGAYFFLTRNGSSPGATSVGPGGPGHVSIGGEVHGTIFTGVEFAVGISAHQLPQIFLPDISVYLQNTATSATSAPVRTNLNGAFAFPVQPMGTYKLCWNAVGYTSGCSGTTFTLGATTIYLQPTAITPLTGVVYGRVTLKDGAPCRFVFPVFSRNTFTTVTAKPASGPVQSVHANSSGMYLVPALANGTVALTAVCEGAQTTATATVAGGFTQANMTLPNVRPTIHLVYAQQGSTMVRAAAAGSTVHLVAQAQDGAGYPLHYSWLVDPATRGFNSVDAPGIDWTIPSGLGQVDVYLLAHDDHGGNAFWHLPLSTAPQHIAFGGHVFGNNAPAGLAGAAVSINGVIAHTNAQGDFALALRGEAPRYVVTITKPGYQMLSRALYAPASQARFELYQAQQFTVKPGADNTLTESPKETDRSGAQIVIGANTVAEGANGAGKLLAANLNVQMASYNLEDANDQIPGDFGGIDKNGKAAALHSFGALDVALTDAAGKPVNLAPNKVALVRIPIAAALMATAPAQIPVWHYDTTKGMWQEDGVATKKGGFYETSVKHFSAVNMDLAFTNAACTIINVDPTIMPLPFQLHMSVGGSGPQVLQNHQEQWISDPVNIVVREPPNTQVTFQAEDGNGNLYPNTTQTVNSGAATPAAVEWSPPPNPPYTGDCSSSITYNEQSLDQQNPNNPSPLFSLTSGVFLTYFTPGGYLNTATNSAAGDPSCTGPSGPNPNCDTADALTSAYYAAINPNGTKTAPGNTSDFANWKAANGFTNASTRVDYFNLYDLGFGRDMYMQTGWQNGIQNCPACVAYYVTNYPDADDAYNQTPGTSIATVAMEYGPPEGNPSGTPFIRFYVFSAKGANNGAIINAAALDDFGPKNVPALCVVCHNGNIASNASDSAIQTSGGNLTFARFLPFDLNSFLYPAAAPRAGQEASFKTMNAEILTTNPSQAETNLITAWYGTEGNSTLPNATLDNTALPNEWSASTSGNTLSPTLYSGVVQTSCRSCHSTRDPNDPGQGGQDISWDSYSGFSLDAPFIDSLVCQPPNNSMPQA